MTYSAALIGCRIPRITTIRPMIPWAKQKCEDCTERIAITKPAMLHICPITCQPKQIHVSIDFIHVGVNIIHEK